MKLIHCADLHLDSRMERNLTGAQARERKGELCATFARLVRYARENQVAAVLIAGDLFDTRRAESRTVGFVLDQIRNAPETEFFYLRGNHDEDQELLAKAREEWMAETGGVYECPIPKDVKPRLNE